MTKKLVAINSSNFHAEVTDAEKMVGILFWAGWCGRSVEMLSTLDELVPKFSHGVKLGQVDIDSNDDLASKFRVSILPTMIYMRGDQKVWETICFKSRDEVISALKDMGITSQAG